MGCRSALLPLERSVDEACKSLPEFVIWQDLRFDVQVAIRAGQDYADALELLGEDRALHDLFPKVTEISISTKSILSSPLHFQESHSSITLDITLTVLTSHSGSTFSQSRRSGTFRNSRSGC
jgi:hypothetical protein